MKIKKNKFISSLLKAKEIKTPLKPFLKKLTVKQFLILTSK